MPPAARITDMHVCPMVTGVVPHVGGPISLVPQATVLTVKLLQARMGDLCTCVGPPDVIAKGSAGVFVVGKPAARMTDTCAHGGSIVLGAPTVLIGEAGGGGGGGGGGAGGGGNPDNAYEGGDLVAVWLANAQQQVATLIAAALAGTPFCEICFGPQAKPKPKPTPPPEPPPPEPPPPEPPPPEPPPPDPPPPDPPPPDPKVRELEVEWVDAEAWCHDKPRLKGKGKNYEGPTEGKADIMLGGRSALQGGRSVGSSTAVFGQDAWEMDWEACGVSFDTGAPGPVPEILEIHANMSAGGLSAQTWTPLKLRRLPDRALESVSFRCTSPASLVGGTGFGWDAGFRLGVSGTSALVRLTIQHERAWCAYRVDFGFWNTILTFQGSAWAKRTLAGWVYWDGSQWSSMPSGVDNADITPAPVVKRGSSFVWIKDASEVYPEAFADDPNYDSTLATWKQNINAGWNNRFRFWNKDCGVSSPGLCEWKIDFAMDWSDTHGDKKVYVISDYNAERSNAVEWYMSEPRAGVAPHEAGHLLGAYDEYQNRDGTYGALDPKNPVIDGPSMMGTDMIVPHPRHFDNLLIRFKEKVTNWTGKSWPNLVVIAQ